MYQKRVRAFAKGPVEEAPPPVVWTKDSKSQRKRDAAHKQKLGEDLVELPDNVLARFPLADDLREAIRVARTMKRDNSRRRQMQHIGALMREADADRIQGLLDQWRDTDRKGSAIQNRVKAWRDAIVAGDDAAVDEVLLTLPDLDRQALVTLADSARVEHAEGRPPRDARRLFRLLRDALGLAEAAPDKEP